MCLLFYLNTGLPEKPLSQLLQPVIAFLPRPLQDLPDIRDQLFLSKPVPGGFLSGLGIPLVSALEQRPGGCAIVSRVIRRGQGKPVPGIWPSLVFGNECA